MCTSITIEGCKRIMDLQPHIAVPEPQQTDKLSSGTRGATYYWVYIFFPFITSIPGGSCRKLYMCLCVMLEVCGCGDMSNVLYRAYICRDCCKLIAGCVRRVFGVCVCECDY